MYSVNELNLLNHKISMEEGLAAKYRAWACQSSDPEFSAKCRRIAEKHEAICQNLKAELRPN